MTRIDSYIMQRSSGMWLPACKALPYKLKHQKTVSEVKGRDEEEEMD